MNDSSSLKINPEDWAEFSRQLTIESDRGAAVVGASILEHLLGVLLEKFLINDPKIFNQILNDYNAPFGGFNSRTITSYGLGLISIDEYNDLTIIRKVRNDFAHNLKPLSFTDQSVRDKTMNLKIPHLNQELFDVSQYSSRKLFISAVSMISTFLKIRTDGVEKRQPPGKFYMHIFKK